MTRPRTLPGSLLLLAAWLLYACGNAPTAPEAEPTAPGAQAVPAASSEVAGRSAETRGVDVLLAWALDAGEPTTDRDARIARAILALTEERKEIRP